MSNRIWKSNHQPRAKRSQLRASSSFGFFAGTDASDEVKKVFTSEVDGLLDQNKGPATKSTTLYQRAMTLMADLSRYNDWDDRCWLRCRTRATLMSEISILAADNKPTPSTPTAPGPSFVAPSAVIQPPPKPPVAPSRPSRAPSGKPIAYDDVKGSIGSQLRDLESANKGPATRSTTLMQRASTMLADLNQYEPWTDSSRGLMGGSAYKSWEDTRTILYVLINDNRPLAATPGAALPPLPSAPPPPKAIVTTTPPPTAPATSASRPAATPAAAPVSTYTPPVYTPPAYQSYNRTAPAASGGVNIPTVALTHLQMPAIPTPPVNRPAASPPQQAPATPNNTMLIAGIAGGAALLLLVVALAMRK